MKFYESTFDEYIKTVEKYNIHPELNPIYEKFPKNIREFDNLILYGGAGVGKYSQILHLLKRYSPSELKYQKKITIKTDKQTYNYHISDIHYEIDMSFLGCNSKILWHDIYFQIVDIISVKPDKFGIILCKNFHKIHSELLETFYSYIQHYNTKITNIQIKFILMTEHISFIPYNILNVCRVIGVKRPEKKIYDEMLSHKFVNIQDDSLNEYQANNTKNIMDLVSLENIMNMKEIESFSLIQNPYELPKDVFNVICNKIIDDMNLHKTHDFLKFRDSLYDILIYNLDATECLLYILTHFIETNKLKQRDISDILQKTYSFLKYYNNNYRPIYHLENIMYYIIIKIYGY
jgi:hypothetical protein